MLRNLKDLFDTLAASLTAPAGAQLPAEQEHTLQLSTAVLLVEVMRAEPDLKDSERDAVITALRRKCWPTTPPAPPTTTSASPA